jgi:acrylyl-CoA reductase (NADPH)
MGSITSLRALRLHQDQAKVVARLETIGLDELAAGEVVVKVSHSTINFKDALAATGTSKIARKYPLVAGIDLAGTVVTTTDPSVSVGQKVLVNGCGLSETHDGGYAQYARLKADWVIPIPDGLDEFQSMALGTAGYTAALAIHRMEQNGQRPDQGEVLVTGATGGVGSLALDMLSATGYRCVALSGKPDAVRYLQELGAGRVLARGALSASSRPLEDAQWAGAIDNVGGEVLAWITRTAQPWANIASIGMAGGLELKTTVLPFILRGVNLLGINSVTQPRAVRLEVWKRLATDLRPRHLDRIVTRTIDLEQLPGAFDDYIRGSVIGRTVVRIA